MTRVDEAIVVLLLLLLRGHHELAVALHDAPLASLTTRRVDLVDLSAYDEHVFGEKKYEQRSIEQDRLEAEFGESEYAKGEIGAVVEEDAREENEQQRIALLYATTKRRANALSECASAVLRHGKLKRHVLSVSIYIRAFKQKKNALFF